MHWDVHHDLSCLEEKWCGGHRLWPGPVLLSMGQRHLTTASAGDRLWPLGAGCLLSGPPLGAMFHRRQVQWGDALAPSSKSQAGVPKARPDNECWPHIVGSHSVFHIVGPNRVLNLSWTPTFKKSQSFWLPSIWPSYSHGITQLESRVFNPLVLGWCSVFLTTPVTEPDQLLSITLDFTHRGKPCGRHMCYLA